MNNRYQKDSHGLGRRTFLGGVGSAALGLGLGLGLVDDSIGAGKQPGAARPVCAFAKFLQGMSHDDMAESIAASGLNGIEATIRPGGQIEPEAVPDELPLLVEAFHRRGVGITIMASHVNRADDPVMRRVLETASKAGIKRYRMAYYRYDKSLDLKRTHRECRSQLKDLAALNADLGIQAVYQNHAGLGYVGAGIWDIVSLLDGIDPEHVGIAFDVRHATVEGGFSWPVDWKNALPHIGAIYIKDFKWDGRKVKNLPLGEGVVELEKFMSLVRQDTNNKIPVSLHVEYLQDQGIEANIHAIQTDFRTLGKLL